MLILCLRWGYNPYIQDCEEFIFSGCGGNENNFISQDRCKEACHDPPKSNCNYSGDFMDYTEWPELKGIDYQPTPEESPYRRRRLSGEDSNSTVLRMGEDTKTTEASTTMNDLKNVTMYASQNTSATEEGISDVTETSMNDNTESAVTLSFTNSITNTDPSNITAKHYATDKITNLTNTNHNVNANNITRIPATNQSTTVNNITGIFANNYDIIKVTKLLIGNNTENFTYSKAIPYNKNIKNISKAPGNNHNVISTNKISTRANASTNIITNNHSNTVIVKVNNVSDFNHTDT